MIGLITRQQNRRDVWINRVPCRALFYDVSSWTDSNEDGDDNKMTETLTTLLLLLVLKSVKLLHKFDKGHPSEGTKWDEGVGKICDF